jgi:glycerate-2-kinase
VLAAQELQVVSAAHPLHTQAAAAAAAKLLEVRQGLVAVALAQVEVRLV